MKKLLIFGTVGCELTTYVKQLPKGNEEMTVKRQEERLGGSGYHIATVMNGLQFPYELVCECGTGVYGESVLLKAKEEKIPLKNASSNIEGCSYRVIDENGKQNFMFVPGGEYDFSLNDMQYIDADEISACICFGDQLAGEGAEDLLDCLSRLECPLYFVPGTRGEEIEPEVLEEVFSMKPILYLSSQEALALADESRDYFRAGRILFASTEAPVLINLEHEGLLYVGEEELHAPGSEELATTNDIVFDKCLAAYVAAIVSGIDKRNALMFAKDFADRICKNRENEMDEYDWKEQQQRLVRMITYKS